MGNARSYASLWLNAIHSRLVRTPVIVTNMLVLAASGMANNLKAGRTEIIMIVDAFTVFGALLAGLIIVALFYAVKRKTL